MRTRRQTGALFALVLLLALTLSGCVHLDRGVKLNTDGSGSYTLTIGITDQLLSVSGTTDVNQSMNTCGDQVKKAGGSYRTYDESGYTYWSFTQPFKDVSSLNTLLAQGTSCSGATGSTSTGTGTSSDSDTFKVTSEPGFLASTFHVTGHMSLKATDTTETGGVDISQFLKDAHDSIAISMPGWITSHNGGTVNGNTITYTVHYGEEANIDVTGGGITLAAEILIGAVIVLLLLTIVLFIVSRLRRRGPRKPDVALAGGASAAMLPTTQVPYTPPVELPTPPPTEPSA